jgi:hypothetical protein
LILYEEVGKTIVGAFANSPQEQALCGAVERADLGKPHLFFSDHLFLLTLRRTGVIYRKNRLSRLKKNVVFRSALCGVGLEKEDTEWPVRMFFKNITFFA